MNVFTQSPFSFMLPDSYDEFDIPTDVASLARQAVKRWAADVDDARKLTRMLGLDGA